MRPGKWGVPRILALSAAREATRLTAPSASPPPPVFYLQTHLFSEVEPRGFQPLTSAVQRRILNIVVVHQCSKTPANKHILPCRLS
jgi:hypothetical protein